ncbi:flagellar biosynthesis protein FlhF [Hymenobacter lapidiphilus]|uniref:hypothetical protein n=1 Tax=Hymenobacter sp. CCM 8763 TaxID=2303334 RepID=UPI00167E515F|nr:hypothetical protein [Hymenobacter sp. CCM 8763]
MSTASSRVLLLGWNEVFPPQPAAIAPLRTLVQQLAPLANLAVLLPHEPQPAFAAAGDSLRTTGLAELDLAAIRAAARTSPSPAAWQAPAAPYIGSGSPAAPYQGATPRVSARPIASVAPAAWRLRPASRPAAGRARPPTSRFGSASGQNPGRWRFPGYRHPARPPRTGRTEPCTICPRRRAAEAGPG